MNTAIKLINLYIFFYCVFLKGVLHMNILCDKSKLIEGVNIILKAISGKSTMPILECIVIDVKENQIHLIANNLELGIETIIDGAIKEEGSVAVNAKFFFEIIRKLPSDEVSIAVDENYMMDIHCGKAKFNIAANSAEEFPFLPKIMKDNSIQISQFTLREIIQQTAFSISDNDNTKVMTGELFEIKGNMLQVVSLDGHRISIRKTELKENYDDIRVIIPGKTVIEISKILNGGRDDMVTIFFTDKHVLFEFDQTVVLSRLIEGEFFRIEKMLSTDYETKLTVNKKEMLDCIDRTTLLIRESDKKPVIVNIADDKMGFHMESAVGTMNEEISVEKEGKDIMIGFNPKFLIDALRVIEDENITIYMINPKAPCFIRNKEETYTYLILPVNF